MNLHHLIFLVYLVCFVCFVKKNCSFFILSQTRDTSSALSSRGAQRRGDLMISKILRDGDCFASLAMTRWTTRYDVTND